MFALTTIPITCWLCAWLARPGGAEKSMWDRVYGWGCPHVDSIAPDAAGGAVVVGHDGIGYLPRGETVTGWAG